MKKSIKILAVMTIYMLIMLIGKSVYATVGTTNSETVRLREKASTDSKVVELIEQDQELNIISEEGDWYKVEFDNGKKTVTGYVRNDMVKVKGEDKKTETDSEKENEQKEQTNNEEANKNETENQEQPVTTEETKEEEQKQDSAVVEENKTIKIKNQVEIKILPLISSSTTGTIKENTEIMTAEILGNWCYIEAGNQSGWAMVSKIKTAESSSKEEPKAEENKEEEKTENEEEAKKEEVKETKTLYVSGTTVNFREESKSDAKIIEQLSINQQVKLIEEVNNTWSKVEVNGKTGYIVTEYLSEKKVDETTSRGNDESRTASDEKKEETTTKKSEEKEKTANKEKSSETTTKKQESKKETTTKKEEKSSSSKSSSKVTGSDVIAYAKKYLGYKYVYGGTSPSGFDCSGFTQYVYKHFGYSISRTSSAQRSNGKAVSKANLQAGDIVCFSGHVGLYVGGNKFIHAENPSTGVRISSLSQASYKRSYITARRIID